MRRAHIPERRALGGSRLLPPGPALGSGVFDPASIAGYCWDLNAELGISYGAGGSGVGLVAAVADQSSSGANASQATPALQATRIVADASFNGHDSIDHTVLDSSVQIATSLGLRHVFCVARYPGTIFATFNNLLSRTPFSNIWQGQSTTDSWRTIDNIAGVLSRDGVTTDVALSAVNDPHLHESLLNALDTSSTWMVGASAGAGSGRQFSGRWARLIGFNVPVAGSDLTSLRLYLKQRYGTP
jgi:hypothetical protein